MTTIDMSLKPSFPVQVIFDTAAIIPINGVDANTSQVARVPFALQIEPVPDATTVVVETRLHASATWVTASTLTGPVIVPTIITYLVRLNFVRVRRSVGIGAIKVYAQ